MNKHKMREEAVERLRDVVKHQPFGPLCADDITQALVGDEWVCSTVDEDAETIINLLSDDEPFLLPDDIVPYFGDEFAKGPRDADGILWSSGDMSDSPWGVIEGVFYDCTRREWLVRGHDISAPWVPAGSVRHAPMRTAAQRESDLVELLKDAAKDYQHEREEVEWQKEMYRSLSDHAIGDMVLLPHDADGEVIHLGDELQWDDGERFTVIGIGGSCVFYANDDGIAQWTLAGNKHHYHKPTVDEILDELEGMRGTGDYEDVIKRCAELGRTLRELLKEDGNEDQA